MTRRFSTIPGCCRRTGLQEARRYGLSPRLTVARPASCDLTSIDRFASLIDARHGRQAISSRPNERISNLNKEPDNGRRSAATRLPKEAARERCTQAFVVVWYAAH